MKRVIALLAILAATLPASRAFAQANSVWLEDMTAVELKAALDSGKTTGIYYCAGIHENAAQVVLGKHLNHARILAERVARELGNAIVLPISPYAPGLPGGDPMRRRGNLPGTLSMTDDVWATDTKQILTSAIFGSGFKYIAIVGDHGYPQDGTTTGGRFDGGRMKKVAEELDAEWKPKGTHVFYVPTYLEHDEGYMRDVYLKLGVPENALAAVDDASEALYLEPARGKWTRPDQFNEIVKKFASAELGKRSVDFKVATTVRHVRQQTATPRP